MTQAYYQSKGIRTVKLYRGTDGGKTGPKWRRQVEEIRRQYPDQWPSMTVELKETSLVGYSNDQGIGFSFGKSSGGITVARDVPVQDIFIPHELWPKRGYMNERENIVFGFPGTSVPLGQIII